MRVVYLAREQATSILRMCFRHALGLFHLELLDDGFPLLALVDRLEFEFRLVSRTSDAFHRYYISYGTVARGPGCFAEEISEINESLLLWFDGDICL